MTLGDLFGIDGFWGHVRLVDFIDIAIVSVSLAIVLGWLKRRANRPILLVALVVFGIYALARWWNLYLTLQLFWVGAFILLAATLLAYQDDLRRGFEQLVSGNVFRRRGSESGTDDAVLTLTEAAFDLAERGFGALIVLRGAEHLDRHLHGGWAVEGKPSLPLLLSIFDPHTPAHDGAVIIDEHGQLDRAGVHLPLSANLAKFAGFGTRHAAALGLAESSDAVVICVSEEHRTVSIAAAGEIAPVASPEDLTGRLGEFYRDRGPNPPRSRGFGRIRDLDVKLVAVALATILWVAMAAPTEPVQQSFDVRVELMNIPESQKIVAGPMPSEVTVTLVGPDHAFRQLDEESLRLVMDLSRVRSGYNYLPSDHGQLEIPEALRPVRMAPETVFVEMEPAHRPPAP